MHKSVIVIGAGIGGLTAAALLAKEGYGVKVFEQAAVTGGCASTFHRRGFTFDVGATQVAGLEPGGIHGEIFADLGIDTPEATPCDPACAVYLAGESQPISLWRDRQRWHQERQAQFPGSESFWQCLDQLFEISWRFQGRQPILPPRNLSDLGQLVAALRPDTLLTLPYSLMTVTDLLRVYGLQGDRRLRQFLDLQLKLYSQVDASETALLYGATALGLCQAPRGLYHLQGSMQVLSDRLEQALNHHGGQVFLRHSVEKILVQGDRVTGVRVKNIKSGLTFVETADQVVANVTIQDLVKLLGDRAPRAYQQRLKNLPPAAGAFVIYLGIKDHAIPLGCPPHLQFLDDGQGAIAEVNSLFVSVSQPEDGRAPRGYRTLIASSFTEPNHWWQQDIDYAQEKESYTQRAIAHLGEFFDLRPGHIIHCEAATPRTFARFTARDRGIVGGISQRLSTFGPFGIASRTPLKQLWLVGDSVHPGEGTAGVSYSARTVVHQIQKNSRKY